MEFEDFLEKVIVLSIALGSVGALVMGSGLAAVQQSCALSGYETIRVGASGYFSPVECSKLLGYAWTILIAQAAVLIGCTVALSFDLSVWKVSLVGSLAVTIVLSADTANTFVYLPYQGINQSSEPRAVTAGACLCIISNLILLISIGRVDGGIIIPDSAFHQTQPGESARVTIAQQTPTRSPQVQKGNYPRPMSATSTATIPPRNRLVSA